VREAEAIGVVPTVPGGEGIAPAHWSIHDVEIPLETSPPCPPDCEFPTMSWAREPAARCPLHGGTQPVGFVIQGHARDGEDRSWSEVEGWVSRAAATRFNHTRVKLPAGAVGWNVG
jgi:hypothetical protein